jgi:hypothetical protein
VLATALALALAALGATARPPRGDPLRPQPLHVVVRTQADVHVGKDLRYQDGKFRLAVGEGDLELDEADVLRISVLRTARNSPIGDPVVSLAARIARNRQSPPAWRQEALEGMFILPEESVAETARWLAPKVRNTELLALLCVDVISRCTRDEKPEIALAVLAQGEEHARDPERAFVFGLMHAALLLDQEKRDEADAILQRLGQGHPSRRARIFGFRMRLRRDEGPPRPGPPGPAPRD